jgi:hypothetical protein
VFSQHDHGLDSKRHARLALADGLVLGVVRDIGRRVKMRVDAVAHEISDHIAAPRLCVILDHVAELAKESTWSDESDSLIEAFSCRLDNAHGIGVVPCPADVVCLVEIAVIALVVQRYIEVDDVAVEKDALIRDTMADNLVHGRAERFRKEVVVEGRWIRLDIYLASSAVSLQTLC